MEQETTPPTHPSTGKGLPIAAMIIGIIAVIAGVIPCLCWLAIVLGAVGILLSILGLRQAKETRSSKGMTIAGLVCSIVAIGIVIAWLTLFAKSYGMMEELRKTGALDSINKAYEKYNKNGSLDSLNNTLKQITDSIANHNP